MGRPVTRERTGIQCLDTALQLRQGSWMPHLRKRERERPQHRASRHHRKECQARVVAQTASRHTATLRVCHSRQYQRNHRKFPYHSSMDSVLQAWRQRGHASEPMQQHHDEEHPHGLRQLLRCGHKRQVPPLPLHLRKHILYRQENGIFCRYNRKHHLQKCQYQQKRIKEKAMIQLFYTNIYIIALLFIKPGYRKFYSSSIKFAHSGKSTVYCFAILPKFIRHNGITSWLSIELSYR